MIPCLNGGKCRGVNTCRCPPGFLGEHCEIELTTSNRSISQRSSCSLPCRYEFRMISYLNLHCFNFNAFSLRIKDMELVPVQIHVNVKPAGMENDAHEVSFISDF